MRIDAAVHGSAVMTCDCATTWHNTPRSGGRWFDSALPTLRKEDSGKTRVPQLRGHRDR